jgi:GAF domain-containing protein
VELAHICHDRLAEAQSLLDVIEAVKTSARALMGAAGATLVLREGGMCFYADEDAVAPLWKGQRFPITQCISGWAMLNARTAIIPDIYADDRIPHELYRPTFVVALVMVPVGTAAPVGAIGAYWDRRWRPADADVHALEQLAAAAAAALERVGLADAPWAPNFRPHSRPSMSARLP